MNREQYMGLRVSQLEQENADLRVVLGALLMEYMPQADQRGVDATLLPHQLERVSGWTLAVHKGIGFGMRPPYRIVMTRPHATVTGTVEEEPGADGDPAAGGGPPRPLPPGGPVGGSGLR